MTPEDESVALPKFISVDDHVVEPAGLWRDRLPKKYVDEGPHTVRRKGRIVFDPANRQPNFIVGDGPDDRWCDIWLYEDIQSPLRGDLTAIGPLADALPTTPVTYDDMLPGCFEQGHRLTDMELNHTEASLCFPTIPRFCGQLFLNRSDVELAHLCVRAYNDWMIEDWCAGDGAGHLIPLTIVPLWDVQLAAQEVRRCADLGSHAVAFSESPSELGLPSIHGGAWDPFFAACAETETVINMHIGSSSKTPETSPGAPIISMVALTSENSVHALVDWLLCGALPRYPSLKIALSESQVGWMPFILERLDSAWRRSKNYDPSIYDLIPDPPSSYVPNRVYACVFDDAVGLALRDHVGMSQIMFETDYPHADSTFPNSKQVAEKMIADSKLSPSEARQFLRSNAVACYDLGRLGIEE